MRRSRPFSALAHAHTAARSWLIVSDQAISHRLTVAHFGFRPPTWCRSTPPSQQLASDLAAVFRPARTPDGQNAGLPPPPPTGLVFIASGTLEMPGVRRRSAASWPHIAWCRSTPSSLRTFRPGFSGQIWTCVGAVTRGRWLSTAGAHGHPSRVRVGSIRDGGASCRCCLRLSRLIVCVFASRAFAGGSGDLGACRSYCDAATAALRVWRGL